MILASLWDVIQVPFGYLLSFLYQLTSNYGLALIIFAVLVKVIMLPLTIKSKKSMMKMSRLQPRIQEIERKYPDDKQKQQEAIQKLQQEEGVGSGCGGCLWSLLPLLLMFPLYTVIREPIAYMLHESSGNIAVILETLKNAGLMAADGGYYEQVMAAPLIPQVAEQLKVLIPTISESTLAGLDFTFLGINLGAEPTFAVWKWAASEWTWSNIGATLIPLLSAGSQVLSMFISQWLNNSLITDEKGLQDKEAAKNSQQAQTGKMMIWIMPLMSLWIGFSIPTALSLYWLIQGIVTTAIDVVLTKRYRRIYDEEDALRLQRHLEEEAIEAEKERQRAERRASNPDGITTNTSKKKQQRQQQRDQEAARAAARKEYEARKGGAPTDEEEEPESVVTPDRPFSRGRAYDPNRYKRDNTEE